MLAADAGPRIRLRHEPPGDMQPVSRRRRPRSGPDCCQSSSTAEVHDAGEPMRIAVAMAPSPFAEHQGRQCLRPECPACGQSLSIRPSW